MRNIYQIRILESERDRIVKILSILKNEAGNWKKPMISDLCEGGCTPFEILIGTILSLRTKDDVSGDASRRLFKKALSPEALYQLSEAEIAKTIYPVGFYKTKAKRIRDICKKLIDEYDSRVPDDLERLLEFRGVGRKTANLVITAGFNKPGICVDTHVHRISNRLGYVSTKTPEKTEFSLREKLPKELWLTYNDLLVAFGQNLCKPVSPFCSVCPVKKLCPKIGVFKSR